MPVSINKRTAVAIAIAACFPATAFGNAARVDFAVGNVTATGTDGRSRTLTRGSEISQGDTVNTQNGRAQLRFSDGAYMSLQPQTEFRIEEFHYAGKEDGKENIVMNLIRGGMRTVTGLIGRTNRHSYKLRTEVATIGIRGTEYSVQYTNSIEVFCAGGSINLENQGGSLTISGGQGASVQNQQTPPRQTSQPPVLSPTSTTQQQQEEGGDEPTNPTQDATCIPGTEACSATQQVASSTTTTTKNLFAGTYTGNGAITAGTTAIAEFNQQGTFDSSGGLTSFTSSTLGGTVASGTSSVSSQGNDTIIAWGRWTGGTTSGLATNFNTSTNPLHYVVGLPATNMPTSGTATYTVLGHTTPSFTGSITGATLNTTSTSLTVDFASSSASMAFSMNVMTGAGSQTYSSTGIALSRSGAHLSGSGFLSGGACGGFLNVQGFLAGDGASRAGTVYRTSGLIEGTVNGAIAFKK